MRGGGGCGHGRLPGHGGEAGAEVVAGDRLGAGPDGGDVGRGAAGGPAEVRSAPSKRMTASIAHERVDDGDGEGVAEAGQVVWRGRARPAGRSGCRSRAVQEHGLAAGVRVAGGRARVVELVGVVVGVSSAAVMVGGLSRFGAGLVVGGHRHPRRACAGPGVKVAVNDRAWWVRRSSGGRRGWRTRRRRSRCAGSSGAVRSRTGRDPG